MPGITADGGQYSLLDKHQSKQNIEIIKGMVTGKNICCKKLASILSHLLFWLQAR